MWVFKAEKRPNFSEIPIIFPKLFQIKDLEQTEYFSRFASVA
jgi:hypothetical protein